jgi:hypothetical protein
LLAQFPAQELDQLATKEFVRAEVALVRVEIESLRAELRAEIAELRAELRTDIAELRTEMHQLVNRMFFTLMGAMVGLGGLVVAMTRLS